MDLIQDEPAGNGYQGPQIGAVRQHSDEKLSLDSLSKDAEWLCGMVARSQEMRALFENIRRIGPTRSTVLLQGALGTGKELAARALHAIGGVRSGPFVTFNCSWLTDSDEEEAASQLFGREQSGENVGEMPGYFRAAAGGTLFLDEIDSLPFALQGTLLRVLETSAVQPVGSSSSYHVDVRTIAAARRDLEESVAAGTLRADLVLKITALTLSIPELASRQEDIRPLSAFFLEKYNRVLGNRMTSIRSEAMNALESYSWPGNVRELSRAIEEAVAADNGDCVEIENLPSEISESLMVHAGDPHRPTAANREMDGSSTENVMRATLERSLRQTSGNRRRAANLLGISRSTLYRMLTRYGLDAER